MSKHTAKYITKPNYHKQVVWQDLRHLTLWQKLYNIVLPYPFLLSSWYAVSQSWYLLAVIGSYFFVITAYRQGHDLFHHNLGTHKHISTLLLFIISLLSFSSLHSMKYSHLFHHQHTLSDDDSEGYLAHLTWYQALFGGLLFRYRIYVHGYRLAPKHYRYKIIIESLCILLFTLMIFYYQFDILLYQFAIMFIMNILSGLVAVWGLHHDCDEIGRTQRNPIINALSFNLFYHAEHHLFPAVPTQNLPILAKRLDKVAPYIQNNQVIPLDNLLKNNDKPCPIKQRFA